MRLPAVGGQVELGGGRWLEGCEPGGGIRMWGKKGCCRMGERRLIWG